MPARSSRESTLASDHRLGRRGLRKHHHLARQAKEAQQWATQTLRVLVESEILTGLDYL